MQTIKKTGSMPRETAKGFKTHQNKPWGEIPEEIKASLRKQLEEEQKGLCCYCCKSIVGQFTHIEHLVSRKHNPSKYADYNNLLLSCNTSRQCDNAKGDQVLPLTPLMDECDEEIKINLAGELEANTNRGQQSLDILNLNNRQICANRKRLLDMMIFCFNSSNPYDRPYEIRDKQTLMLILDSLPNSQRNELQYIIDKLIKI